MIEFKSAIVDELGNIVCWCENLSDEEIEEILTNHIEWRKTCIEC